MTAIVFYCYKYLIAPGSILLLQLLRPFIQNKMQEVIQDKNQNFYQIKVAGSEEKLASLRPIWIHAASGEIEYARPIIRELKKSHPDIPILVTYSSPSAKKILANISEIDVWASLPWEMDYFIHKFIEKWNPRVLLFSRTDVWPVLAANVKSKKIPMTLFSATFADNSSRLSGVTRLLTNYTLNLLSEIHCVSHEDFDNVKQIGIQVPLVTSGDTRFDQVFHRLENPKALKSSLIPSTEDFVFIAGSTWPEDEAVLLPAIAKSKNLDIRFIIAPHETTDAHLEKLETDLKALSLTSVRYSAAEKWRPADILIIDQVGILAELYTWADMAFVGGSFKKQVHSVMEPLAAGLPVLVGPHHKNNREALFYQKKNYSSGMIVHVVHSPEDVAVLLQRLKKNQSQLPLIKEQIRSEIGSNRNSTQRVLLALEPFIQ